MKNTSIYTLCVMVFINFPFSFSEGKACWWLCCGREAEDKKEEELKVIGRPSSSQRLSPTLNHIPYHLLTNDDLERGRYKGADPLAPNTKTWELPRT